MTGSNPTLSDSHTPSVTTLIAYLPERTVAPKPDRNIAGRLNEPDSGWPQQPVVAQLDDHRELFIADERR